MGNVNGILRTDFLGDGKLLVFEIGINRIRDI